MHDTPADLASLASSPALQFAITTLGAEVTPAFDTADRNALRHQATYQSATRTATVFGTISILISIVGLIVDGGVPLLTIQGFFLLITVVAVVVGLLAYRHENWLLERCRAEQLRALKFRYLLDETLWTGDERERQGWVARLRSDVDQVRALRREDIAAIAGEELVPGLASSHVPDDASIEALTSYYERKRLGPQREYFLQASRDSSRLGARALPLFFFGAVILEIIQVVLTVSDRTTPVSLAGIATWFGGAAVALPAIWAGIRTYQGAREDSRNATRSKARHGALAQLTKRMVDARGNPAELIWTMRLTEFVLLIDQREWLRLLREAEWYG